VQADESQEARDAEALPGASEAIALCAGIPQDGAALGDPAAPITLTDLSDLQCPHCTTFIVRVVPVLVEKYVRKGQLRLVFGDFPILGPQSQRAARMAMAVGLQNHMWEFVDIFMRNQKRPGSGYVTEAFFQNIAAAVPGVDVERALADRDSAAVTERLDEVAQLAARLGIHATPTFLLGKTGAEPERLRAHPGKPEAFIQAIDALLAAH
jgi:protein-disulfide isomerase